MRYICWVQISEKKVFLFASFIQVFSNAIDDKYQISQVTRRMELTFHKCVPQLNGAKQMEEAERAATV